MKFQKKYILTGMIVLAAILAVLLKYWQFIANPWTRDGQVRASVIQVAPRVSGPIVNLPIRDNQFVRAGDVLFEIDPRTYQASLDQALAQLDETTDSNVGLFEQIVSAEAQVEVSQLSILQAELAIKEAQATVLKDKAEYERQKTLIAKKATSQRSLESAKATYEVAIEKKKASEASLEQSKAQLSQSKASLAQAQASLGSVGEDNPQIRVSQASLRQAELNLEFTRITAPVDGYVTNLNLRIGSPVVANQAALALVDTSSYWIDAFFKETLVADFRPGDRAVVTLMSYPDQPIEGYVDSLGWGIAQQDGSTGFELLPSVSPTFEWIRLAQRVPVRIELTEIPEGVQLRVGTTASVLVKAGTSDGSGARQ
jgi:multidrug resistance efflux pump